jgi:predicted dehydrogenase
LRIDVACAGLIGKRHIEMIRNGHRCELSAIVDPSPQAAEYARELGVPVFNSLGAPLAQDKPDGIVLASPNQMHVGQELECIAAGVPALVEKPVARTLEQGIELAKAAEANAKMLVGHHRRRRRDGALLRRSPRATSTARSHGAGSLAAGRSWHKALERRRFRWTLLTRLRRRSRISAT